MPIEKKFIDKFVNVTSKAALASSFFIGKKDKIAADKAAVDSMRSELNKINIQGEIVIGEGELDEAPMLYIGERVGNNKNGPEFDIAVDPLEGTNFVANNLPGALSVIAIAEKNNLFKAPETYMEKISTRVNDKNVIDLDFSVKQNISNLSDYLNKNPENLTACILNRPRHKEIIDELNKLKVNLKLITDGDVSGALLVAEKKYNVDIFLGIGGGPEGVLSAAALDSYNCNFQGRFLFKTDEDKIRAKKMGIDDLTKKYELNEIVTGDSIFCATGITSGDLVKGVEIQGDEFISETLVTHKSSGIKKVIKLKQNSK
ncbi:class II fructose-bisphosphatase [Candidatus Pelagibacter sp.]|uniref:class II fructose-bisphosphatase n=1 Tax=Candidatus Pelagibacter sp. TaxID=2024849 RepID=UPI003F837FEB